jgi:hypothetical protein
VTHTISLLFHSPQTALQIITPIMSTSCLPTLQSVLADCNLYVEYCQWFELLQDQGREMTDEEREKYLENSRKNKPKNNMHGSKLYLQLYKLAKLAYNLTAPKWDAIFAMLPSRKTSKTFTIHQIGKSIAACYFSHHWSDIHSATFHVFAKLI